MADWFARNYASYVRRQREAEAARIAAAAPPVMPEFLAPFEQWDAAPDFVPPRPGDSGPAAAIAVDVQVRVTAAEIVRISQAAVREASAETRTAIDKVDQSLRAFKDEVLDAEIQRRVIWGR